MFGAIIGDITGMKYENTNEIIDENKIELLDRNSSITDDTIMSIAVAESLAENWGRKSDEIKESIADNMKKYVRIFPDAGYGEKFKEWALSDSNEGYESYGNGSAMRCSCVGWMAENLNDVNIYARLSAEVTHNSSIGIKGAQALASAVFLARNGCGKRVIQKYLNNEYGIKIISYSDLITENPADRDYNAVNTVTYSMSAFMSGENFEDVIKKAVALGGDTDTKASIAGSIAEAYYGIDENVKSEAEKFIPEELKKGLNEYKYYMMMKNIKRLNVYKELTKDIEFFKKKSEETRKKRVPIFMQQWDETPVEIEELVKCVDKEEIIDRGYVDTIELHNLCMDFDVYKRNADEAGIYLLRAMLTSIVKQEIFNRGIIDEACEKGVIYSILNSMDKIINKK
ncbi:hypothetical protein EXD82_07610 [Peptacetobacter hominis]|uniref:ADP-ribosylglycohydrolase n=1 Tax=Peptacetobacter hominis TaxID=2743610 RepID=A0A544QU24_9FIRM|nr:ADP-ribosylglycohydrolase family protein [Peptacetobacter hominis]TQQ84196.1 hypothetical protein EXD82_07610 [Peptacetobacter hominis]